ncbi:MAG: Rid family detoxifying hydrolase [Candidatus Rhabdochlamydia sp.]
MKEIKTPHAPGAIGPYSQAVLTKGFLFISGQLPLNPKTNQIEASTIEGQAHQVFANLQAILHAANLLVSHVVRVEVYLKDLSHFPLVNALYAEVFTAEVKPARQTVQVAKLPLDALIEIACIACSDT